MSVNVNRSVSDQFYRYKMPRLIAKVTSSAAGSRECSPISGSPRRGGRAHDNVWHLRAGRVSTPSVYTKCTLSLEGDSLQSRILV